MKTVSRKAFLHGMIGSAAMTAAPFVWRSGARGAEPITLKLASIDTPISPNQTICERFAELVSQKTGGAIKLQIFAVGQLGTLQNIMSGLQTGIIDFATHTAGFLESFFPRVQLIDLPFLCRDVATAEKLLDGPIGQKLFDDMPAKGMLGLTWGHYGLRVVETTDRPVRQPADLAGVKIRVQPGAVFAASFKALGAIPIVLDISELYIALSQRTVGGFELPFVALLASKLYEVSKFVGVTNHVYNAMALIASKGKFEALDKSHQSAIREAAAELQPFWRKLIAEKTVEARAAVAAKGMTIDETDYEAFRRAMTPVYAEFRDNIGGDLLDAAIKMSG